MYVLVGYYIRRNHVDVVITIIIIAINELLKIKRS